MEVTKNSALASVLELSIEEEAEISQQQCYSAPSLQEYGRNHVFESLPTGSEPTRRVLVTKYGT